MTIDSTSGIAMPRNGREWRAILDAAGLQHIAEPAAIWGHGYAWFARKPHDKRTARQRTRDRRRKRGWR